MNEKPDDVLMDAERIFQTAKYFIELQQDVITLVEDITKEVGSEILLQKLQSLYHKYTDTTPDKLSLISMGLYAYGITLVCMMQDAVDRIFAESRAENFNDEMAQLEQEQLPYIKEAAEWLDRNRQN
ncbi:MAG TPA: hypothetical protein P5545_05190 [Bacteroidota bacterium]|mgnify:FL=1|nr:hypothetical protein [Candidatus Kapabacteria bacterium]HRS01926.1 hypothetical protein [Bacteroidota bacterium]